MSAETGNQDSADDVRAVFQALPARFKSGVATKEISYHFSIDEQEWTVIVSPESCQVIEGMAVEKADSFLKTTTEIFLGTIRGEYTPSFMDLMTGKIKANNPALLQTFKEIFGG